MWAVSRAWVGTVLFTAVMCGVPMKAQTQGPPAGLTREFVTAGVSGLSAIREWFAAMSYAIAHNQPVSAELLAPLRRTSETQVALAMAATRNENDRAAGGLLNNELINMRTLSANYQAMHDRDADIRTDALSDDALATKVSDCMGALAGLAPGAQVQDVPSCH